MANHASSTARYTLWCTRNTSRNSIVRSPGTPLSTSRTVTFEGLDLRKLDTEGIDFSGAYFRASDLRGLDLRELPSGASLSWHAQISGTYFPAELSADEILMSVNFGTRLRYRTR